MNFGSEHIAVIAMYAFLTLVNYIEFRRLIKEGGGDWFKYEANFLIRYSMKKIGLLPTQLLTFGICVGLTLLLAYVNAPEFLIGTIFGYFLFVTVHDFITTKLDEGEK